MDPRENKKIGEVFRDKFRDHESSVSEDTWKKISERVSAHEESKPVGGIIKLSAVFLIALTGSLFYLAYLGIIPFKFALPVKVEGEQKMKTADRDILIDPSKKMEPAKNKERRNAPDTSSSYYDQTSDTSGQGGSGALSEHEKYAIGNSVSASNNSVVENNNNDTKPNDLRVAEKTPAMQHSNASKQFKRNSSLKTNNRLPGAKSVVNEDSPDATPSIGKQGKSRALYSTSGRTESVKDSISAIEFKKVDSNAVKKEENVRDNDQSPSVKYSDSLRSRNTKDAIHSAPEVITEIEKNTPGKDTMNNLSGIALNTRNEDTDHVIKNENASSVSDSTPILNKSNASTLPGDSLEILAGSAVDTTYNAVSMESRILDETVNNYKAPVSSFGRPGKYEAGNYDYKILDPIINSLGGKNARIAYQTGEEHDYTFVKNYISSGGCTLFGDNINRMGAAAGYFSGGNHLIDTDNPDLLSGSLVPGKFVTGSFIKDSSEKLKQTADSSWKSGPVVPAAQDEVRGKNTKKDKKSAASNYPRWQIGLTFIPASSFRNLSPLKPAGDMIITERNNNERAKICYASGLTIQYSFLNKFSLQTGLLYFNVGEKGKYQQDSTGITKSYSNNYNYLGIPVLAGYRLTNGRIRTVINTGVALVALLNAISDNDGDSYYSDDNNKPKAGSNGQDDDDDDDDDLRPPYAPLSLVYIASVEFNYQINQRLSLSAGPSYKYFLTSIYTRNAVQKSKPYAYGFQFGVKFTLK